MHPGYNYDDDDDDGNLFMDRSIRVISEGFEIIGNLK